MGAGTGAGAGAITSSAASVRESGRKNCMLQCGRQAGRGGNVRSGGVVEGEGGVAELSVIVAALQLQQDGVSWSPHAAVTVTVAVAVCRLPLAVAAC